MAWNPTPEIASLRDFGEKFDRPVVVTFSLDPDGEHFHVTTYGKTRKLCKLAGSFGAQIAEAVRNGTISPPQVEPCRTDVASTWTKSHSITKANG